MSTRCFLAVTFSVAATRRVADEVERKRAEVARAGAEVAWVPPANLHVTLAFLGSIRDEALEAVVSGARRVASRHAPFAARARGLGAFPSLAEPRVLWVGVDAAEALAKLERDLTGQLVELGFPKEERAYHAHLTVGRVKTPVDLTAVWNSGAGVELASSPFTEIIVYESRMQAKGAEYVARARLPLGRT